MKLCDTCGRRPSERSGPEFEPLQEGGHKRISANDHCSNQIHDLADLAPEMARWLRLYADHTESCDYYNKPDDEPCTCLLLDLMTKVNKTNDKST